MKEGIQQSIVDYKARIEAILFANGSPLELFKLANVLNISTAALKTQLEDMRSSYDDQSRGLKLIFLDNKVQLATKEEYGDDIKKVLVKNNSPISPAAMETLAIIAYNQPVSRAFIEQVRGVSSNKVINSLVEKGLIEEAGRLNIPGRPITFKTTDLFLSSFSLNSLDDLPNMDNNAPLNSNDDINKSDKGEDSK